MERLGKTKQQAAKITTEESDTDLVVNCGDINYHFDKRTGYISKVMKGNKSISLSGGPILAGQDGVLSSFTHTNIDSQYIIQAAYRGNAQLQVKWIFTPGQPARLDYTYSQTGESDFTGITFNYPEEKVTGMKWLGRGPYRVWKNRLRGLQYGLWHKKYNNTVTGETWGYPEFKGYHAEVKWVVFENSESPFTVFTNQDNMFLQVFHPAAHQFTPKNNYVEPPFPKGDIGFLQGISAIGTKFHPADEMGLQGQKNRNDGEPVTGTLWFAF